jgi:hypothetical protein
MKIKTILGSVVLGVLVQAASAQQPAPGFIQGVVTDSASNTPLGKVIVELRNPGTAPALASTITDDEGRFFLTDVRPGAYRVVALRSGYSNAEYGQRRPGGPSQNLVVAPGQRISDLRLAMIRAGVISGRVTDNGTPVGIADVVAVRVTYVEGQPNFNLVLTSRTNDLGEYHLFWLPPGRYVVMAIVWDTASNAPYFMNPEGSNDNTFLTARRSLRAVFTRASGSGALENEAHVPFYYPNTPDPQNATVIEVRPGAEFRNIDIQATALPTRRVKGTLTGAIPPPGPAVPPLGVRGGPIVRLIPLQSVLNTNDAQSPQINAEPNGSFEFPKVVPGRYMLMASIGALSGSTPVEVRDRDVDGVSVALIPGLMVSGQVVMENVATGAPTTVPPGIRIILRPEPFIPGATTYGNAVTTAGTFVIPQPPPNPNAAQQASPPSGVYRVLVNPILVAPVTGDVIPVLPAPLQNLYVKSIRIGDIDVMKDGLRVDSTIDDLKIVIGTNPGVLNGRVTDDRRQLVPSAVVALVPNNHLRYRVTHRWVATDLTGAYQFSAVAPGDYLLFAWESMESGGWQDAGVLRDFESIGRPVHIDEGGKVTLDLSVIPARN